MKKRMNSISVIIVMILSAMIVIGIILLLFYQGRDRQKDDYRFILIPKTIDEDNGFWTALIEGTKLGAGEYNVMLEIMGTRSEEDIAGQNQIILEAIAKKPDVILLAPCSTEETIPYIEQASQAGIKVILVDSVVNGDYGDGVVATDNVIAGKELGVYARRFLDDNSQIGIVGHVQGVSTAVDREIGIREGLGEDEQKICEIVYCDSSYEKAYELTKSMIAANPDIDLIITANEYSTVGAARAVKELGIAEQVKVVGFDNSLEEIQLLEQDILRAIVIQKPVNMGYLAVEQGIKVLQGKSYKEVIDSGYLLINRGNMYLNENQRMLYPIFNNK